MMKQTDAVVIGAGISGLSCAYTLTMGDVETVVLESAKRAGGVIETLHKDGYIVERGPNSSVTSKPDLLGLIDALGITHRVITPSEIARNRYVLRDGVLHSLPASPVQLLRSKLLSSRGKMRMVMEPFIRRRRWADADEESVADFTRRRFGQEVLEYLVGPFVAGVYAGRPDQLGVRASLPMLVDFERDHGSVIRGGIRERKRKRRAAGEQSIPAMISFDQGMSVLPDALASVLGESLHLGSRVNRIASDGDGWIVTSDQNTFRARSVILATPADVTGALLRSTAAADASGDSEFSAIDYAPISVVHSAYRRNDVDAALDGFGFLVPEREQRSVLGCIFSSSLFPNRCPDWQILLTTFVGGMRSPELCEQNDNAIAEMVSCELAEILGVSSEPIWTNVTSWARAIPQYGCDHLERVRQMNERIRGSAGIFLAGNYLGGVAVEDCVEGGVAAAGEAERYLANLLN